MSERKVSTDALDTLGTVIDDKQRRDAIHLAVEPVEAGQDLEPGQHITVVDGIATGCEVGKGLGIVDPFLEKGIKKGQKFWFVMYPRKVHSLRHVWTHPDFPVNQELGEVIATEKIRKLEAENWLRKFLGEADCPGYETVMELIEKGTLESSDSEYYSTGGVYDEDYLHFNGTDAHGAIPPEFWDNVETVLGKQVKHRSGYFSCSC